MALDRGGGEPKGGLQSVLFHPLAAQIHGRQIRLSPGQSAIGGETIPGRGLDKILRHP